MKLQLPPRHNPRMQQGRQYSSRTGLLCLVLLGVLLMGWAASSMAAWSWTSLVRPPAGAGAAPGNEEFLPVEQAFRLETEQRADTILLHWRIAEGYYLYRNRLAFALPPGSPLVLGTPRIPPGQPKDDPFLGRTIVFHDQLTVTIPVRTAKPGQKLGGGDISLTVRYQGCAAKGLCYPPQQVAIALRPTGTPGLNQPQPRQEAALASRTPDTDDNQALRLLEGGSWWLLPTFVGFGVLLSLTPCVWPMIPLLLRISATETAGRRRGLAGVGAYVLGMACAYGMLGVVAGYTGSNLQFAWQSPLVLAGSAVLLVLLACGSFGLFTLQMPPSWQSRLHQLATLPTAGRLGAIWLIGLISAWIAGPCVTPALAGAMLYITRTGDMVLGASALFALGLGMGIPLLAMALLGERWLPRSGPWMRGINHVIGLLLLGGAVLLVQRILPPWGVSLAALSWLVALAVLLMRHLPVKVAMGATSAAMLGVGLWQWPELASLPSSIEHQAPRHDPSPFRAVDNLAQLQHVLQDAERTRQPVMLDIYADWCTACQAMERRVFADATVRETLHDVIWLRSDITANTAAHRELLQHLGIVGPPTVLFFLPGRHETPLRLVGEMGNDAFLQQARPLLNHG